MNRFCPFLLLLGFFTCAWADGTSAPNGAQGTALVTHDSKIETRTPSGGYAAVPAAAGSRLTVLSVNDDSTVTVCNSYGFKGTIPKSDVTLSSDASAAATPAPATAITPPAPDFGGAAPFPTTPAGSAESLDDASANSRATVFDDLADKLAQAKSEGKPLLLFLVDERSPVSKKIDLETLSDASVKNALGSYVMAHIELESSQGAVVRENYGWLKGPLLAVLNKDGEAFDALDLSSLTENLVTSALPTQMALWLDKNAKRFQLHGPEGYTQTPVPADDPVRQTIANWDKTKEDYADAHDVVLLDEGKIKVQPDGSQVAHFHVLTYLNDTKPVHEQTLQLGSKDQDFHLIQARTITPDLKENPIAPGDVQIAPFFSKLPSLDSVRSVKYTFPGAKKGTFMDEEYEYSSTSQMPGVFDTIWGIESGNIPNLDSHLEVRMPASFAPDSRVVQNSAPVNQKVEGDEVILTWSGHSENYHAPSTTGPPSFPVLGYVVIASKTSWADIGKWFLSQTDQFRTHSPEMDAWIDRRVEAVAPGPHYEMRITNSILTGFYTEFHYLALNLSTTGFQPHPVADTFKNKWGDCKDFAFFLQECLKKKGIQSELVLLQAGATRDFTQELPRPSYFNHCLLHVEAGAESFFVDPTSGLPAGALPLLDTEVTGLLCQASQPVPIQLPSVNDNNNGVHLDAVFSKIDKSDCQIGIDLTLAGNSKVEMRSVSKFISPDLLETVLSRVLLSGKLSGVHFTDFTMTRDDDTPDPMTIHLTGTAHDVLLDTGDLLIIPTQIGTDRFFAALPNYLKSDSSSDARVLLTGYRIPPQDESVIYHIPRGMEVLDAPKELHVETDYFKVDRIVSLSPERLTVETIIKSKFIHGDPAYVQESTLPQAAHDLVKRLSQPVVFHKKPEQQLLDASITGDVGQVASLATTTNMEATDKKGFTLLMTAAQAGQADVVRALLAKGAKINAVDNYGRTPLALACRNHQSEAALALINAGADVNIISHVGQTPLFDAADAGDVALVKALLDHHVDVNVDSIHGTALSFAICSATATPEARADIVNRLLAAGADVNLSPKASPRGDTSCLSPLGAAIYHNLPDLAELLLNHGAKADSPNSDGATPLACAAEQGNIPEIDLLLAHGADINKTDAFRAYSPLVYAIEWKKPEALDHLIKRGANVNAVDSQGMTALTLVCANIVFFNMNIVKDLVENGADVNATDKKGVTALSYAGNNGHVDCVNYLKEKGANLVDVKILKRPEPSPPYPAARTWALGTMAIYAQRDGLNPWFLGEYAPEGLTSSMADGEKFSLRERRDVKNKDDLLYQLAGLKNNGERARFLTEGQSLADKTDAEYQETLSNPLLTPEQVAEIKAVRQSYQKWKDRTGLAWDLCNYVRVVSMGYRAGYLSESESWALIQPVAVQIQKSFTSWSEMEENFLDGREIWAHKRDPTFDASYKLLANPNDPNSPWNRVPWNCDLTHIADGQTAMAH